MELMPGWLFYLTFWTALLVLLGLDITSLTWAGQAEAVGLVSPHRTKDLEVWARAGLAQSSNSFIQETWV